MQREINPLTAFFPIVLKINVFSVRNGAFSFDCLMISIIKIPIRPPKKNPIHIPGPPKSNVRNTTPVKPPNTAAFIDFFELTVCCGVSLMIQKNSTASAITDEIKRNIMIFQPICSKPVKIEYNNTSKKITTVPGNPNKFKKIPANNIKMKIVNPAPAKKDNLWIPLRF